MYFINFQEKKISKKIQIQKHVQSVYLSQYLKTFPVRKHVDDWTLIITRPSKKCYIKVKHNFSHVNLRRQALQKYKVLIIQQQARSFATVFLTEALND